MRMRIRSIHPDRCQDDRFTNIPLEVEATYSRLCCYADDEGRGVDHPKLIKAAIYPLHDHISAEVIDRDMECLAQAGLLVRYRSGGVAYFEMTDWSKEQKPRHPKESDIPPPSAGEVIEPPAQLFVPTSPVATPPHLYGRAAQHHPAGTARTPSLPDVGRDALALLAERATDARPRADRERYYQSTLSRLRAEHGEILVELLSGPETWTAEGLADRLAGTAPKPRTTITEDPPWSCEMCHDDRTVPNPEGPSPDGRSRFVLCPACGEADGS